MVITHGDMIVLELSYWQSILRMERTTAALLSGASGTVPRLMFLPSHVVDTDMLCLQFLADFSRTRKAPRMASVADGHMIRTSEFFKH
ncbi:uncharacterized protein N7515_006013 [Penicillium bovifimosum]|uniref:Uncharacterized protein n=1 Tax=Penicillium bovifimosum TaxID=126998 RepID=A0A9W9GTV2_9EURO|nr:uncharacterized protein N7515_006013 [Penicillium bovifimosum]KAJ5129974.1 hypothetical protein N7515_006013 [Penicillium bovifimosum]